MGIALSFLTIVVAPLIVTIWYLFTAAADQYASRVGFSVRSEEIESAQDLLGGISSSLSGSSSKDTDILYAFIQSQDLVQGVDQELGLVEIWSRPEGDPVFAYRPTGDIEDLVEYWQRMVRVFYDSNTGLIELRVHAFRPEEAQRIAEEIVRESTVMINDLSAIARADATAYAREELDTALERLKTAREALTRFRSETRLVDPTANVAGQQGLLNSLETQLASAQIELNLLRDTARESDPRIDQAERRIAVIEDLIDRERQKFSASDGTRPGERDYSSLVGEYERLSVDLQYAEESYIAAQNAYDTARAEAQRKSRYLAVYANPTLPQSARYPQREVISGVVAMFLFLFWASAVLVYYSLRDRR